MCRIERIKNKLMALAQTANGNFKHAAAITNGSKILTTGVNDGRRTKWGKSVKPCLHAEVAAISSFLNKFPAYKGRRHLTLWVIRIPGDSSKCFELKESMPCADCYNEAKKLGINRIAYSKADGTIKIVNFNNFYSNYLTKGQTCIYK